MSRPGPGPAPMMGAEPEAAGGWGQGHEMALTRLLIGTKGLFVLKYQERLSGRGWRRLGLIVCSYPEPVRMMICQNVCSRQQQVSVNGSSGVYVSLSGGAAKKKG